MTRSIDIRQLRYFVAVAEERNFRRAAERLHITQPPLSRQVNDLEQALGARLLARDTRRVQLTPAGELALREFGRLVATFDETVSRVAAAAPAAARLRLGTLYWGTLTAMAPVEQALRRARVASGIDVQTLPGHEAIAAVRKGDLDAALVAAPADTGRLEIVVLGSLRLAACVPARSALARKRVVSLQDLNTAPPFHFFPRHMNAPLHDHFARQYAAHGFFPPAVAPAREALGVYAQIASGRGTTCMPAYPARFLYPGVVRRPLRESVTMDAALVFGARLDPSVRAALAKALRQMARRSGLSAAR